MGILPDTQNCGLCMHRESRERFPCHRGLAIPTCITARAWRTYSDAYRDSSLAVYFEVSGGENFPSIPGACTTANLRICKEVHVVLIGYHVNGLMSVYFYFRQEPKINFRSLQFASLFYIRMQPKIGTRLQITQYPGGQFVRVEYL